MYIHTYLHTRMEDKVLGRLVFATPLSQRYIFWFINNANIMKGEVLFKNHISNIVLLLLSPKKINIMYIKNHFWEQFFNSSSEPLLCFSRGLACKAQQNGIWNMCQVPCTCLCLSAKFPGPRPRPKVLLPPPPPPTHQVFLPTQLQLKRRADLTLAYLLSCAHLASLAAERASWNVFVDKHSHESFLVTVPHPQHSTPLPLWSAPLPPTYPLTFCLICICERVYSAHRIFLLRFLYPLPLR